MRPPVKYPYLAHDGVLAFAHRGGDRAAPENTLAAFEDAVAHGFRYLETDVHASRDGVLFAFHDDDLTRMVGNDVAISTLSAKEIDRLQLPGGHAVPRMADLLERFPEARFNIDAKAWPAVAPLADLINHMAVHERVCIGSFSDARIAAVLKETGDICHSVGRNGATRFRFAAWARWPTRWTAGAVQFPERHKGIAMVTPASIAYAHRRGLQVHVWTINDESTMHRLLDMGVDGLMTDDCALLKSVLQQRGRW